ncbi:hypothetical protein BH10PSE11_BH10PSE11_31430 [soil metagenome]
MTPQECVLDAVLRAQGVLTQYIEPGPRDCATTLSRLFVIFADDKLSNAVNILNLETVGTALAEADNAGQAPASPSRRRTSG